MPPTFFSARFGFPSFWFFLEYSALRQSPPRRQNSPTQNWIPNHSLRSSILRHEQMLHVDISLAKRPFAPRHIKVPHALESLVKSHSLHFRQPLKKTLAPQRQGPRVVRPQTLKIRQAHPCNLG